MALSNAFEKAKPSKKLYTNTLWMFGTEAAAKGSRVFTILAMAATLAQEEYGIVMLALAIHEIIKLVQRGGAGAQIVQCKSEDLPRFCQNVSALQWCICALLITIQCAVGLVSSYFYAQPQLALLLCSMSVGYLLFPPVAANVYLLQRNNNMRRYSLGIGSAVTLENLLTAIAFIAGAGIYAIAIGKLVYGIVWFATYVSAPVQHYGVKWHKPTFVHLIQTSASLAGTEFAKAIRQHLDIFIAGKALAPDLFGLYSFAKSAGIGLSQSLSYAYTSALYPYLCTLRRQSPNTSFVAKSYVLSSVVGLLFVAQALAAPLYIKWLFPEQWHEAGQLVGILCLCAIPMLWQDTQCCLRRVNGAYHEETQLRFASLSLSLTVLVMGNADTPTQFAYLLLISAFCWPAFYACCAFLGMLPRAQPMSIAKE